MLSPSPLSQNQQYGRSLTREKALSPEPLLAYAMNGEPLTRHQGSPLIAIPTHLEWNAECSGDFVAS